MNANEVIRAIIAKEQLSPTKVSVEMGHARTYVNTILSEGSRCRTGTLAEFCEATNYELVARNKDDGFEFVIDS